MRQAIKAPIFVFDNLTSTGIDLVTDDAILILLDNGSGAAYKTYQILNTTGTTATTTIDQFLKGMPTQYEELVHGGGLRSTVPDAAGLAAIAKPLPWQLTKVIDTGDVFVFTAETDTSKYPPASTDVIHVGSEGYWEKTVPSKEHFTGVYKDETELTTNKPKADDGDYAYLADGTVYLWQEDPKSTATPKGKKWTKLETSSLRLPPVADIAGLLALTDVKEYSIVLEKGNTGKEYVYTPKTVTPVKPPNCIESGDQLGWWVDSSENSLRVEPMASVADIKKVKARHFMITSLQVGSTPNLATDPQYIFESTTTPLPEDGDTIIHDDEGKGFWRKVSNAGLRGSPVANVAELKKLDARDFEMRMVIADPKDPTSKDKIYVFSPRIKAPKPEDIADDAGTGYWVLQNNEAEKLNYKYKDTVTTTPAHGFVSADVASEKAATKLFINKFNEKGKDQSNKFNVLDVDDKVIIAEEADSSKLYTFIVTAPVTLNGDIFEIEVKLDDKLSSADDVIPDDEPVTVTVEKKIVKEIQLRVKPVKDEAGLKATPALNFMITKRLDNEKEYKFFEEADATKIPANGIPDDGGVGYWLEVEPSLRVTPVADMAALKAKDDAIEFTITKLMDDHTVWEYFEEADPLKLPVENDYIKIADNKKGYWQKIYRFIPDKSLWFIPKQDGADTFDTDIGIDITGHYDLYINQALQDVGFSYDMNGDGIITIMSPVSANTEVNIVVKMSELYT